MHKLNELKDQHYIISLYGLGPISISRFIDRLCKVYSGYMSVPADDINYFRVPTILDIDKYLLSHFDSPVLEVTLCGDHICMSVVPLSRDILRMPMKYPGEVVADLDEEVQRILKEDDSNTKENRSRYDIWLEAVKDVFRNSNLKSDGSCVLSDDTLRRLGIHVFSRFEDKEDRAAVRSMIWHDICEAVINSISDKM